MMLQLSCLGAPQIKLSTGALPGSFTPKAIALLVYLAVTQRPHSRDVLADLLWSETNNQRARDNLRYLLPELRRPLGDYLLITTKSIAFNRQAPYWLDVERLRTPLATQPEACATPTLQAALNLYQGEFLAGFTVRNAPVFEAWLVRQREELHALVVQSGYTLANRYWQQSDYASALATTQRLLQWESWHEAGHRLQMQLLAHTGQRAAALAQYEQCRTILADELGVEPEAATTALYEQICRGGYDKATGDEVTGDEVTGDKVTGDKVTGDKVQAPTEITLSPLPPVTSSPPPPVTLWEPPGRPHNLPTQLTPFFGRTTEIAQLSALLMGERHRLVTLVGEGGIGKTRLALAVAQKILAFGSWILDSAESSLSDDQNPKSKACPGGSQKPKFSNGVWWIGLAGITPSESLQEQLVAAVAQAIGLSFGGAQPLFTQLLAQLRTKTLLLLLDNAEHLLPGLADFVVALLQECPRITLLVTSRHLLNLQAEFVWRLDGLPVPPHVEHTAPAATGGQQYSSMALFLERSSRLHHNFAITQEDERAIAAICRLVEGLPLAIELAAALTKQYTCTELYAALQRDYTLLGGGLRDLPARHRSIQAMLDHSWRLLAPDEAYTLAACSCFAGGFTQDAALAVTSAAALPLYQLVDQSLLQLRAGRFAMHELVRQYAAAQLAQTPAHNRATAARHAAYYMQQLQTLATDLLVEPEARERFQYDLDNLRLAWHWSAEQGDLPLLAQGLEGLMRGYLLLGLYGEAGQLLEATLAPVRQIIAMAPANRQTQVLLVRLLCHTTQFYRRTLQLERGNHLATEALALAQQVSDPALQGLAYHELARLVQLQGDFMTMATLAEQACAQARLTDDPHLLAECLNDLGIARGALGAPLAAIPYFHEALHTLQYNINRRLERVLNGNLGVYYLAGHQYQAAYVALQQALTTGRRFRYFEDEGISLIQMGDLCLALGQYDQAQVCYEQALPVMQTIQVLQWVSWIYVSLTRLALLRGDLAAAEQNVAIGRQMADRSRQSFHQQWLLIHWGHLLTEQGDYAAARDAYQQAIALPKAVNWVYRTADAHAALAALLLQTNTIPDAVTHVEAALALLAQLGLAGANEPFTVYWTAVRVFTAANDARADTLLRTAYQTLQQIAAQLTNETWRRSFLGEVTVNRQLLAAAQRAGMG